MKVSWGGIFGGVLVALGLLMLLTSLGLAIGITAMEPGETGASALGTGAGIWGAVSLLIALFVGGLTATRVGAITDRTTAFFQGALVWVVSMLLIAYLAASGVASLASGVFGIVGGAAETIGQAVQGQGGIDIDTSGTAQQIAQQPEVSTAAWITFLALVLSLAAAVVGSMLGRRKSTALATEPPASGATHASRSAGPI